MILFIMIENLLKILNCIKNWFILFKIEIKYESDQNIYLLKNYIFSWYFFTPFNNISHIIDEISDYNFLIEYKNKNSNLVISDL